MKTDHHLFSELLGSVQLANQLKIRFDVFWKRAEEERVNAWYAYAIRHTSLLNCFNTLLFLFGSRQLWESGGLGIKAVEKNVSGPVFILMNGDQIDKILSLLTENEEWVKSFFKLYESNNELSFLEHEIHQISSTIIMAEKCFEFKGE